MIRCGGAYDLVIGPFSSDPFMLIWAYHWVRYYYFCMRLFLFCTHYKVFFFFAKLSHTHYKVITEFTKSISIHLKKMKRLMTILSMSYSQIYYQATIFFSFFCQLLLLFKTDFLY